MRLNLRTGMVCASVVLGACTTLAPPDAPRAVTPPERWHAPLPHGGTLSDMRQWWQQFNDPALLALQDAAQTANPTLAMAQARIMQARAAQVSAQAGMGPTLNGNASASRGNAQAPGSPPATVWQVGAQASWEIDLFGAQKLAANAAQARFEGAQALWHEARVSVAAELAQLYFDRRSCEQVLAVAKADAASRTETARLADLSAQAGLTAPATAALAKASAAEGRGRYTQQQAQCDTDVKGLVALTALTEPQVLAHLASTPAAAHNSALLSIAQLPVQVLAQRPDVFNAERELMAARAEVGVTQAQELPRLGLSGSVAVGGVRTGGSTSDARTWSLGPLQLTLPILDGGRNAANTEAARAAYASNAAAYAAKVRQAVREVEEALVRLDSATRRDDDARLAAEGYTTAFDATQARYKAGLASVVELEESRRNSLAAQTGLLGLQRERLGAWIALYRAAGGGWSATQLDNPPPTPTGRTAP